MGFTPSFSFPLLWQEGSTLMAFIRLTWVGWDEGAVESQDWNVRVDENSFLFAMTRVEECVE